MSSPPPDINDFYVFAAAEEHSLELILDSLEHAGLAYDQVLVLEPSSSSWSHRNLESFGVLERIENGNIEETFGFIR